MPPIRSILQRIFLAAALSLCILYIGDYLWLRYRIHNPKAGDAFGTIKLQPTYAIPHKDGKSEFVFGDPVTQPCVHSLFPQARDTTCWYVARNTSNPIPMSILP